MSRILRTLAKCWNTVLFPFFDFEVSAFIADTSEGDKRLKLLITRCSNKDRLGTRLSYEWDRVTLRLYGTKQVYQGGDFAFLGEQSSLNISKSGEISLDPEKQALDVNVSLNGRPYKYNGHHLYREEPAQPAA
jgi:hypothetical protein